MDLQDQAGANPITIHILSTGFADVASINTWVAAHSVTTIKVAQLYDQSGNSRHLTQATLAPMPQLTVSGLNSLPVLLCPSGTTVMTTAGTFTVASPMTFSAVAERTANFTTPGAIIGANNGNIYIAAATVANKFQINGATEQDVSATDSVWHAFQALANGASSFTNLDGSDAAAAGSIGANAWNTQSIRIIRSAGGTQFNGNIAEMGLWAATSTSTDRGNLYTNQHGTNGYNGAV
jgi:hypothetical protein